MAKKTKSSKITQEQEYEAQQIIDRVSPEELEEMKALRKEFDKMPKVLQEAIKEMVAQLSEMSEEERNEYFDELDRQAKHWDEMCGEDEDFEDSRIEDFSEGDYPHFLPRPNVHKYTLRVTLKGIEPKIYRKFNVPSNITLRHLSELILELMGWTNEHLNQFRKGNDYYAPAYQREGEDDFFMGWGRARNYNQEEYTISDILSEKSKSIEWEYDFGDSWCHEVRLSSIGDYEEDEPLVSFVKGERDCPPEDCGGIWGYRDLLVIYDKKKSHKRLTSEEKEQLEWYFMDKDFDPDAFDSVLAREICKDYCE